MRQQKRVPLGQLLVEKGIITTHQLQQALEEQIKTKEPLATVLTRLALISEENQLLGVLAGQINVPFVRIQDILITPQLLNHLSAKAANYYKVFPIKFEQGVLTVASRDPLNIVTLDELALITQSEIETVLSSEKEILESIREHYGVGAETIERMMSDVEDAPVQEIQSIDATGAEASISHFLNQILLQAYKDHATDIHIEPFNNELRIRYRIDGVLYDASVPDNIRYFQEVLVSRIKIMSNLNIAEKRMPQDGRFKVRVSELDLDLRVSILPSAFGEAVVIRILNSVRLYSFDEIGFVAEERRTIDTLLQKPHGIIFITGPTGSGKTTTLYTCLSNVNKENIKIISIEDPVEYQLRGVTQIQTHPQIGLNFAHILRSVLRSDPDIIMVGEVRDPETAQITIQVALTGHLVFSTLHTNDAASAATRLLDMGIEPYLIASSVECFMAQRLVRILCAQCKIPVAISADIIRDFDLKNIDHSKIIYEAKGCKHCRQTGFIGRSAIAEFLIPTDEIRRMIVARATSSAIKEKAISLGMKTLRQHGWEKIIAGITSPSEVLHVTAEDS